MKATPQQVIKALKKVRVFDGWNLEDYEELNLLLDKEQEAAKVRLRKLALARKALGLNVSVTQNVVDAKGGKLAIVEEQGERPKAVIYRFP